jgi:hypothetical protein
MFPVPSLHGLPGNRRAACRGGGEKLSSFFKFSLLMAEKFTGKILTDVRKEFSFDPPKTARRRKPMT